MGKIFLYSVRKNEMKKRNVNILGFSLVEMLVVLTVFSILAIVATQSLVITFKGARKSESIIVVRENVKRVLSVMERQLYNAKKIECVSLNTIQYHDQYSSIPHPRFSWDVSSSPRSISSGSSVLVGLTTDKVDITQFDVNCVTSLEAPDMVIVTISAVATENLGVEGAQVTVTSRILLRSY